MTQPKIVQLPRKLRASCYECGRECIAPEACTAPCGQGPLHRYCLHRHVNNCNDCANCDLPEPEPHQNIAAQARTITASSSQLYVKCPLFCGKLFESEEIKFAKEGRDRVIWNCSSCRTIKKKQVKLAWYHFVCVQCTHTQGKTCLIQYCTSSCRTREALERKMTKARVPRMFKKAISIIESLKKKDLMERLTVLRTAWNLGSDRMPQPWFRFSNTHTKRKLMSMLHSAFEAFAAKRSASIPAGLYNDMADDFHFAHCLTKLHKKNMTPYVFKYKHKFYQEVSNFCNNYYGLKNSAARAKVENTIFRKKNALWCLVTASITTDEYLQRGKMVAKTSALWTAPRTSKRTERNLLADIYYWSPRQSCREQPRKLYCRRSRNNQKKNHASVSTSTETQQRPKVVIRINGKST